MLLGGRKYRFLICLRRKIKIKFLAWPIKHLSFRFGLIDFGEDPYLESYFLVLHKVLKTKG